MKGLAGQEPDHEMPITNGMEDMLLGGFMPRAPRQIEHSLQESAPDALNMGKAVGNKIMMNTNDLFDNVLHLDEDVEQQMQGLDKTIKSSAKRQNAAK